MIKNRRRSRVGVVELMRSGMFVGDAADDETNSNHRILGFGGCNPFIIMRDCGRQNRALDKSAIKLTKDWRGKDETELTKDKQKNFICSIPSCLCKTRQEGMEHIMLYIF